MMAGERVSEREREREREREEDRRGWGGKGWSTNAGKRDSGKG